MVSSLAAPDPAIAGAGHGGESLRDALRRVLPLLPVFAALLIVTIAAGLLITNVLDGVVAWDTDVVQELAASRTPALDDLTGYGTFLAESIPSIVLTVLAIVVARVVTKGWTWSVFVAVAVGSEKLIYLISSIVVDRQRPPVPTVGETYATASFPSGHVGTAVALYGAIALMIGARIDRRAVRVLFLALAAGVAMVVAYCRMYRGFHFPTDVMTGAVLGLACLLVSWWGIGSRSDSRPAAVSVRGR